MISTLKIAKKSLLNRRWTSLLTIFSLALSVALLLLVDKAKVSAQDGFTQSISQTDLIVGGRAGTLNLLLYTVFNMGNATANVSWESYQDLKQNPGIEWTIPYSLGDGHRGFRTVATTKDFFNHYHFHGDQKPEIAAGQIFDGIWDVVLGSEVAKSLHYDIGSKIVLAHGVARGEMGMILHDDKPFRVVGIMRPTGTPIDRSLYITLEGMEAIHMDWQDGAFPNKDKQIPQDKIIVKDIQIKTVTSFFVRMKSRIDVLRFQRVINTYKEEPLMAIIPGVELSELWRSLGFVEQILRAISFLVLIVGMSSMLIALLTSLNERRREMAIFRALGASPGKLTQFLILESAFLTFLGVCLGLLIYVVSLMSLKSFLEYNFNFYVESVWISMTAWIYLFVIGILGLVVGVIPALQARNRALKDGLAVSM